MSSAQSITRALVQPLCSPSTSDIFIETKQCRMAQFHSTSIISFEQELPSLPMAFIQKSYTIPKFPTMLRDRRKPSGTMTDDSFYLPRFRSFYQRCGLTLFDRTLIGLIYTKDTQVNEQQEFRRSYFNDVSSLSELKGYGTYIYCYRGKDKSPKWMDEERRKSPRPL